MNTHNQRNLVIGPAILTESDGLITKLLLSVCTQATSVNLFHDVLIACAVYFVTGLIASTGSRLRSVVVGPFHLPMDIVTLLKTHSLRNSR